MKVLVLFDLGRPPVANETFPDQVLREQEDKPTEADVLSSLQRLGHEFDVLPLYDNVPAIVNKLTAFQPDIVFNLSESFRRDRAHEPNIPALLDLMRVRYTGAGPEGLFLCKDKALAKKLLTYHHIRVSRFSVSHRGHSLRKLKNFSFPAFVKPVGQESSEGIAKASFAKTEHEALERARYIHEKFQCDALIEEYIDGRELYISVVGSQKLTVFPPRELFFEHVPDEEPKFATAKAKWDESYREKWGIHNGPSAPLPRGTSTRLFDIARKVYRLLKIRGPGRLDVRLTPSGDVVVMEANPNPSLARDEDFAQSALAAGLEYDALIQKILDTA